MVKRCIGILFLIFVMLLVGCDDGTNYAYEDFLGEWDLPNDTHISIMQDDEDPSQKILDIRWHDGLVEYFAMVGGTVNGNILTGSYSYNKTIFADEDDSFGETTFYGEPEKSVTITLTMHKNKPKVTCTGEGPLAGKTFSM